MEGHEKYETKRKRRKNRINGVILSKTDVFMCRSCQVKKILSSDLIKFHFVIQLFLYSVRSRSKNAFWTIFYSSTFFLFQLSCSPISHLVHVDSKFVSIVFSFRCDAAIFSDAFHFCSYLRTHDSRYHHCHCHCMRFLYKFTL